MSFDLIPHPGLDMKTYRVHAMVQCETYACGCNAFEMCGLLCAHIIRVMVHLNVQQIPPAYMLHRWSVAATTPAPDPGANGVRFGVPGTNTLKYNSLCRKMNDLASDACFDDGTYSFVSRMIDEASKTVAAMKRANNAAEQEVDEGDLQQQQGENQQDVNQEQRDAPTTSELKNPQRKKPKGRPPLKVQRRKPLTEVRAEANKRRKKKESEPKAPRKPVEKKKIRPKKCPFCGDEGHTMQDCKGMKDVIARQAEINSGGGIAS